MEIRETLKDNLVPICVLLIILGAVFFTLSVITIFEIKAAMVGAIGDYANAVGAWSYWIIILAGAALAVGIGYLYSYIKDAREFEKLIDTNSKKVFIKNYEELESLAWKLTTRHRERFYAKRDELKVRVR